MKRIAKCPKCQKIIVSLILITKETNRYDAKLNENNQLEYSPPDLLWLEETQYECPYCHETLTNSHEEALKILKGEEQ